MATAANHDSRPRAAIIANPNKVSRDELEPAAQAAEGRNGWAPALWLSNKPSTKAAIAEAEAAGVDVVIVAGGDGTVRRAIRAVVRTELPISIIPTGTGNLLARNLGLPLNDFPKALDIAMHGAERKLDVLEVEAVRRSGARKKDVSVVLSGVGVDAAMIANTQPELKKRFGWLAYIDGVRRSIGTLKPFPVRISIDGQSARPHRVAAVFVANLADLPGNLSLVPDAAIDDGLLDLIVLQPKRFIDWLFIWRRFSWENAVLRRSEFGNQLADTMQGRNRNQVLYRRGREARIWIDGDPQPFQIDGDAVTEIRELSVRVNQHGVRVRVPEDS